jgi:hypothetical protein
MSKILVYAFWILPVVIQAGLAVIMVRRKLRTSMPLFFSYVVFQLVSFCIQFPLFHFSYAGYFYAYWTSSIIACLLGFTVMHEIFTHIFRPYDSLRELAMVLFRWAAVVLVLVAMVMGASGSQSEMPRLLGTILALERSVRVMQCGMVLFLLLFSSHLGLTARHHVFGISLGFGVFAAVDLIVATLRTTFGQVALTQMALLKPAAYACSIIIWTYWLRAPEPERKKVEMRQQAERWNFALADATRPVPQDSFMAAVESAVERVLTKRQSDFPGNAS